MQCLGEGKAFPSAKGYMTRRQTEIIADYGSGGVLIVLIQASNSRNVRYDLRLLSYLFLLL